MAYARDLTKRETGATIAKAYWRVSQPEVKLNASTGSGFAVRVFASALAAQDGKRAEATLWEELTPEEADQLRGLVLGFLYGVLKSRYPGGADA